MYRTISRWWQLKYFFNFHPENWGNDSHFWRAYFSDGGETTNQTTMESIVDMSMKYKNVGFQPRKNGQIPSLKLTARTCKWMVGNLVSFWDALFWGAKMLVSGRVDTNTHSWKNSRGKPPLRARKCWWCGRFKAISRNHVKSIYRLSTILHWFPGTQMTLVLVGKGLVLEGSTFKNRGRTGSRLLKRKSSC